jgi:hypothetical protein
LTYLAFWLFGLPDVFVHVICPFWLFSDKLFSQMNPSARPTMAEVRDRVRTIRYAHRLCRHFLTLGWQCSGAFITLRQHCYNTYLRFRNKLKDPAANTVSSSTALVSQHWHFAGAGSGAVEDQGGKDQSFGTLARQQHHCSITAVPLAPYLRQCYTLLRSFDTSMIL